MSVTPAHRPGVRALDVPRRSSRRSAKSELARLLNAEIDRRGWVQREAARQLGLTQPMVCALKKQRVHGVSLERMLQLLVELGLRVEIVIA